MNMSNKTILNNNLKALCNCMPALYTDGIWNIIEQQSKIARPGFISMQEAKDGTAVVVYNDDKREMILSSRCDSGYAVQCFVSKLNMDKKTLYVYCGMSNMEYISALVDRMTHDNLIMLYEPDIRIFKLIMENVDITGILNKAKGRLYIILDGVNMNQYWQLLTRNCPIERMKHTEIVISPNYGKIYPENIQAFIDLSQQISARVGTNDSTNAKFGEKMAENLLANLWCMAYSSTIDQLKEALADIDKTNIPAVIVGMGPSLNSNIDELMVNKDRVFIIATDSSQKILREHDITPDILITVDPKKSSELMDGDKDRLIPMVYSVHSQYVFPIRQRGKMFVFNNSNAVQKVYEKSGKKISNIESGGSVSNNGFSLAQFLGFDKIILMGMDLAFEGDKKHADNAIKEKTIAEEDESLFDKVEGIDGSILQTYKNFNVYRQWFEKKIIENPNLTVINASVRGAIIHGATHIGVCDAITKLTDVHNKKQRDELQRIRDCINKIEDTYNDSEKNGLLDGFFNLKEILNIYQKDCKRSYDYYLQLRTMLLDNRGNDGSIDNNIVKTLLLKAQEALRIRRDVIVDEIIGNMSYAKLRDIKQNIYDINAKVYIDVITDNKAMIINQEYYNDLIEICNDGIDITKIYIEALDMIDERHEIILKGIRFYWANETYNQGIHRRLS